MFLGNISTKETSIKVKKKVLELRRTSKEGQCISENFKEIKRTDMDR